MMCSVEVFSCLQGSSILFAFHSPCRDVLTPHLGRAVSAVNNEMCVGFPHNSALKEMQFVGKNDS